MAVSCETCNHTEVCAIRKGFEAPNKKLAKARSGDDKEQVLADCEQQWEALSEVVARFCPKHSG